MFHIDVPELFARKNAALRRDSMTRQAVTRVAMKATLCAAVLAPLTITNAFADGNRPVECSVASVEGDYTGTYTGEEGMPNRYQFSVNGVVHLDGEGNITYWRDVYTGVVGGGTYRRNWLQYASWTYRIRPDCTGELLVGEVAAGVAFLPPQGSPFATMTLSGLEHGVATRIQVTQWTDGNPVGVGLFTRVRGVKPPERNLAQQ